MKFEGMAILPEFRLGESRRLAELPGRGAYSLVDVDVEGGGG